MGLVVSCALALAMTAAPASGASFKPCKAISFTEGSTFEGSHYGANKIRALRTTCAIAQKVAAKAEGKSGNAYSTRGFSCKAGGLSNGARNYTCKSGTGSKRKQVRFATLGDG
jgi:hypothetical protein